MSPVLFQCLTAILNSVTITIDSFRFVKIPSPPVSVIQESHRALSSRG